MCFFTLSEMQHMRHNDAKCLNIFPRLELARARPKISPHDKNQPWCSSSFFNQLCNINIYIRTYIYTSTLRLLGRFTTCFAQTTTALRLFFALNGTSCLRNEKNLEIFDFKTFFEFCTITMTY